MRRHRNLIANKLIQFLYVHSSIRTNFKNEVHINFQFNLLFGNQLSSLNPAKLLCDYYRPITRWYPNKLSQCLELDESSPGESFWKFSISINIVQKRE